MLRRLFFKKLKQRSLISRLKGAFPRALASDVEYVCSQATLEEITHANIDTEWTLLNGEKIKMPYRISVNECENQTKVTSFTRVQMTIYHCIMTRSCNGYEREAHLKELLKGEMPEWAVPYVIKLCDEYVVEILEVVYLELKDKNTEKYRRTCELNLDYIKKSHAHMISYWNEFYRDKCYRYKNYIGKRLYKECFGYGKSGQKSIILNKKQ